MNLCFAPLRCSAALLLALSALPAFDGSAIPGRVAIRQGEPQQVLIIKLGLDAVTFSLDAAGQSRSNTPWKDVRYFEAPLPSDDQDYSRAIGLMRSGRGAQAVEAFNKVLANSNYANLRDAAARQLASILEAEKKHAEAAAFLARAAADLSDWIYGPELLLERARVLARSPQRDAAIANWKELAANANRFGSRSRFVQVGAAIGLAESQAASGDHTGAETALNQLLGSLSPSDDAALIGQAQLSLARARIAQKKTVPAIEAYRKAVFMPLDGATRSRAWLELAQLLSDSDAPQALDAAAVAMAIEGVPAEVQTEARQLALRLAGQLGKDAAVAPTLQVEYRDYSSNL